MENSQNLRAHCQRCGAEIGSLDAVCAHCGAPSLSKSTTDIDEPWLAPPPVPVDNPYKAPETLPEPPASALWVLLRIIHLLCAIGVFAFSVLIAFFAACFAAGAGTNSFGIGITAGTIVAILVLIAGTRIMNKILRVHRRGQPKSQLHDDLIP